MTLRPFLFTCLLLSGTLLANPGFPKFERVPVNGNVAGLVVADLFSDREGFLWVGTETGLFRYDGHQLLPFLHSSSDTSSISSNVIHRIWQDRDGFLWIGTMHGGTNRLDPRTGRFKPLYHDPNDTASVSGNTISHFFQGNSGALYLVSGTLEINRLADPDSAGSRKDPARFAHPRVADTLSEADFGRRFPDWAHLTFFSHDQGELFCFDGQSEGIYRLPFGHPDLGKIQVGALHLDRRNRRLWLLSQSGELLSARPEDGITLQRHSLGKLPADVVPQHYRPRLSTDNQGRPWLFYYGNKLFSYDEKRQEVDLYFPHPDGNPELSAASVNEIYHDDNGLCWLATLNGLFKANLNTKGFRLLKPYGEAPGKNKTPALFQEKNGTIWFTTNRNLHHYDEKSGRFDQEVQKRELPAPFNTSWVKTMFQDSRGWLWFGPYKSPPFYRDQEGGWHGIPIATGNRTLIRSITEDHEGNIWFGMDFENGGVIRYHPHSAKIDTFRHVAQDSTSLSSDQVWRIFPDSRNRLWITTWGEGINLFRPESGSFVRFKADPRNPHSIAGNYVTDVAEDAEGRIWFGSWNSGLSRLIEGDPDHPGDLRFEIFNTKNGLGDDLICTLLTDRKKRLWIAHGIGLARFEYGRETFKNYLAEDGVEGMPFFVNCMMETQSGQLYSGALGGVVNFHPDSLQDNPHIPPIQLTSFKIFEKEVALDTQIVYKRQLTLPYWQNFLSFSFAALDYTQPTLNQYQYKLEGLQEEWIDSGNRGLAIFTNLSPGTYRFRARGSNHDGIWNEDGAGLTLTITPPWWRTWWAYSLYALMSIGLVVAGRWVVANWRSLINIRARRISHFKLLSPLGKGGMGEVYKALDLNTREFVAIKLLHPEIMKDTQNRKRLTNEGRLLASFSHPNVVRVFELGETGREMFIAMEYLSGGTLQEFLEKNHPIEPARLLVLLREIAGGLAAIHREKIVHRDLKPGNLMLDEQGQVRIMDFGLSKSPLVTTMTSLGTVLGTLGYVAPEQITGAGVDHRVDIFSFGVVMFVMATNKAPFSGENEMALIHAIFNYTPPDVRDIRTDLPEGYSEMVRRCLQKDPADRYPDMAAILGALEKL